MLYMHFKDISESKIKLKHKRYFCRSESSIIKIVFIRNGPICVVNNKGRVEHHQEFWILVAGGELSWVDMDSDTLDTGHMANVVTMPGVRSTVTMPGVRSTGQTTECIGMFEDVIGTVNKCKVKLFFN